MIHFLLHIPAGLAFGLLQYKDAVKDDAATCWTKDKQQLMFELYNYAHGEKACIDIYRLYVYEKNISL